MSKLVRNMLILTCLFLSSSIFQAIASEEITTNSFQLVRNRVMQLGKKYGTENVLLAFDIDCTLLTSADNFGSDVWWNWQSGLFGTDQKSPFLVSKDFNNLLAIQSKILSFVKQYPTEADIPNIVKDFQKKGFKTLVLTARGPNNRDLTEKQLKNNGFDFNKSSFAEGFPGEYLPYDVGNPEHFGLTPDDVSKFKLKPPREVSFFNNIMMVSGQNKGIMVRTLLYKAGYNFKAIVLVDDGKKNTDNMQDAYKSIVMDVVTFRYSYDDSIKRQFEMSNKNRVIKQWNEYKAALNTIFGKDTIK